ncbi:MAG: hypothetical protein ACI89J_001105 [Hyphomicrobiaceae bacterium]|jgi:hypothetical protein
MLYSSEVTVKNDLTLIQDISSGRWPQRIVQALNRWQVNSRLSGAEDNRCNQHMQPIDCARLDKPRDRPGTALNQNTLQPKPIERLRHNPRATPALSRTNINAFYSSRQSTARRADNKAIHTIILQTSGIGREPPTWIEHHPHWAASIHATHSQHRIISLSGSYPNHNGIHMCSQAVQMIKCRGPVNPAAFASLCCNPAIKRLPKLGNNKRTICRRVQ